MKQTRNISLRNVALWGFRPLLIAGGLFVLSCSSSTDSGGYEWIFGPEMKFNVSSHSNDRKRLRLDVTVPSYHTARGTMMLYFTSTDARDTMIVLGPVVDTLAAHSLLSSGGDAAGYVTMVPATYSHIDPTTISYEFELKPHDPDRFGYQFWMTAGADSIFLERESRFVSASSPEARSLLPHPSYSFYGSLNDKYQWSSK